jgi:hypothetical protein
VALRTVSWAQAKFMQSETGRPLALLSGGGPFLISGPCS